MATLTLEIPQELAERLNELAKQENRPLEEVLRSALNAYIPSPTLQEVDAYPEVDISENSLVWLAQQAKRFNQRSGRSDISEHFDDVLDELLNEKRRTNAK